MFSCYAQGITARSVTKANKTAVAPGRDPVEVVSEVCSLLATGQEGSARALATSAYPFEASGRNRRQYTERDAMRIFVRDGFIDRYSGKRLVFPGTLRLLAMLEPEVFPFHKNWKMDSTHQMFWELFPTIDHVVPVARGGTDDPGNLVTTSMVRNQAKSNSRLEELGWSLHESGSVEEWDGLSGWFSEYVAQKLDVLRSPYLKRWHAVAKATLGNQQD